jgi:hypothetical protein
MSGLMPSYILREWSNDGKILAGGLVYFYESGTLTPKPVYSDATLSVPLSNPVALDAGGAADIWLGDGAYRILVKTSTGVQVRSPIDGVVGIKSATFGGPGSNIGGLALQVYDDVRALTISPDTIYVSGRNASGDGGQGWFQLIPGSVLLDDDGIILTTVSNLAVYRRVFDAAIDPRWYGVKYGVSVDNTAYIGKVATASAQHNFPALYTDSVYLTQDITFSAGSRTECSFDGFFNAPSAVVMTFATNAKFASTYTAFGNNIHPTFQRGIAPVIYLSWFGGSVDDDRWTKLAACTTLEYDVMADVSTNIGTDWIVPKNFALDFSAGATVTISALINVSVGSFAYQGTKAVILYASVSYVGTVLIGAPHIRPEWFGALGDGSTDDSLAVFAASKTGRIDLTSASAYMLGSSWSSTPSPLSITGGHLQLSSGKTLGTGDLALESTLISNVSGSWFAGASLTAVSSEMPATYTATVESITGCKTTGAALFPTFKGAPYLANAHLDLISKALLGTDSVGKIVDAGTSFPELTLGTLNLTKLNLDRGILHVRNEVVGQGQLNLTNPLPLVVVFNNLGANRNIFLPVMSSLSPTPNILLIFPVATGTTYGITSQNGNFPYEGTDTMTLRHPVLLYFDYDLGQWLTLYYPE